MPGVEVMRSQCVVFFKFNHLVANITNIYINNCISIIILDLTYNKGNLMLSITEMQKNNCSNNELLFMPSPSSLVCKT